jgi:PAS domain S-box-containing protein
MSHAFLGRDGAAAFGRRLIAPVIAIVTLSLLTIGGLAWWAARDHDAAALRNQTSVVGYTLAEAAARLGRTAKDFSWYDLAIEKLFTRFDVRFAEDTMGAYLAHQYGVDATIVLDRDDKVVFMALGGVAVDAGRNAGLAAAVTQLAAAARGAPANEPLPVSAYVAWQDKPWLAAASAFTPGYNSGRVRPEDRGVLVLVQALDDDFVAGAIPVALVAGATVMPGSTGRGEAALALRSDAGTILGFLTWRPARPGRDMLMRVAPPAGAIALVVLALLSWSILRARNVARRMAEGAEALARKSAALAESDRRQRAVFERVADAILIVGRDGRLVGCNPAGERLFGHTAADMAGRALDELVSRDGALGDPVTLAGDLVAESANGVVVSALARRRDGSHAVVEVSAGEVVLDDDKLFVLVLRDVTERNRAAEALNLLSTGTVVVTHEARILLANRSAERALTRAEGVRLEDGRLRAVTPWDDATLQKLVAKALASPGGDPMNGVGVMNVMPRPDASPLHLIVSPLQMADRDGPPCAAIILRDQNAQTTVNPTFLRQLYGLTRAEARIVVELAKGKRLQEVAEELSVSLNTVRNQLKMAFAKTSTNRQADLVSLVLTTVADIDLAQPANESTVSEPAPARVKEH